MGRERNADWDRIADQMAPWPVVNGVYVEAESVLEKDGGHPTQLAAYGFLPASAIWIRRLCVKRCVMFWTIGTGLKPGDGITL